MFIGLLLYHPLSSDKGVAGLLAYLLQLICWWLLEQIMALRLDVNAGVEYINKEEQ
jgi:di/tricarboxylate transporter